MKERRKFRTLTCKKYFARIVTSKKGLRKKGADMNYIVFDLEWNQCPYGKEQENRRLPFEILEIGAVKLDENKNMVDSFQEVIKPAAVSYTHLDVYKRQIMDKWYFACSSKKRLIFRERCPLI